MAERQYTRHQAHIAQWQPGSHWYVLRTHYREEERASSNLCKGGIETFLPRVLVNKTCSTTATGRVEPLFPQYLFGHFEIDASLRDVGFTRGIHSVLSIGGTFATVADDVIELLRSRAGADGLIRIGEPLSPGDRVLVESGPFASLTAVVERILSGRERVCVLLTAVHSGLRVELATDCIKRLA